MTFAASMRAGYRPDVCTAVLAGLDVIKANAEKMSVSEDQGERAFGERMFIYLQSFERFSTPGAEVCA
jgi:hypothetical protein